MPSYIKIRFIYNGREIEIDGKNNQLMKDIFKEFGKKIYQEIDNYLFLYEGINISQDLKLEDVIKGDAKEVQIVVYDDKINIESQSNKESQSNEESQSKYIICPFCKKNSIINFNNFIISLECEGNHNNSNILIEEIENYRKTQKIKESKTNYICNKHPEERYISYCDVCHKNLCFICQNEHKNNQNHHKTISFAEIMPDDDNLKIGELNETLIKFKEDIKKIKDILNKVEENMDKYYDIALDIKKNYNLRDRNYQILKSAQNISVNNEKLSNVMKEIINKNEIIDKFKEIIELYNKMKNNVNSIHRSQSQEISDNSDFLNNQLNISSSSINNNFTRSNKEIRIRNDDLYDQLKEAENNSYSSITNEIIVEYNIKKEEEEIILLGEKFIKNNKNNIEIFFNEKKQEIKKSYKKNKYKINNDKFEVKIKIISELTDMSYMFQGCSSIISIKNIERLDTRNVKNMSYLFCDCCSLEYLPDISNWDTSNVTSMIYMFGSCNSLKELPDISKWKTNNVTDLSYFLCDCKELIKLPDISKWNTSEVKDLSSMFSGCSKLTEIPNFGKWDVFNVLNAKYMFNRCRALSNIPNFRFKDGVNKDYFN